MSAWSPSDPVGRAAARRLSDPDSRSAADSRERVAFATLDDSLIDRLREVGTERRVRGGEILWEEGDRAYDFYVVLEGAVRIVESSSLEERTVTVHDPGEFTGDVDMLTGRAALVTARVETDGRVLHLTNADLRSALAEIAALGDVLLEAFLMRRVLLIEAGFTGLKIVGSRYSRDTHRLTEFAARNRVPHTWLDLEEDEQAEALLQQLGVEPHETPVVIGSARGVLRNPSTRELAELVGLTIDTGARDTFDLVVVGAGPGGLAASVYGASEGLRTIAVESKAPGGQAGSSSKIENYLGFPSGLSGEELTNRALLQAQKFGAEVTVSCPAAQLRVEPGANLIVLEDGTELAARAVVIATGAEYRALDIRGVRDFEGLGVFYAATETEARLCDQSTVVVVGGGNSAGQAAVFLSSRAANVIVAIRGGDLGKSMSRYLVDRIERTENIELMTHHEVVALEGGGREDYLGGVVLEDNRSGERKQLAASGLFLFIGARPRTDWLGGAGRHRRQGLPADRRRRRPRPGTGWPLCRPRTRPAAPRDQPARRVRSRRRARRIREARRVSGGRGVDGGAVRAPGDRRLTFGRVLNRRRQARRADERRAGHQNRHRGSTIGQVHGALPTTFEGCGQATFLQFDLSHGAPRSRSAEP